GRRRRLRLARGVARPRPAAPRPRRLRRPPGRARVHGRAGLAWEEPGRRARDRRDLQCGSASAESSWPCAGQAREQGLMARLSVLGAAAGAAVAFTLVAGSARAAAPWVDRHLTLPS